MSKHYSNTYTTLHTYMYVQNIKVNDTLFCSHNFVTLLYLLVHHNQFINYDVIFFSEFHFPSISIK